MKDAIEVGRRIKALRASKNLTQQQLADLLGVTAQAVSKWENGDSYPDVQQLISIAERFDTSLDELLRNEKTEYPETTKQDYIVYETIFCKNIVIDVEDVQYLPSSYRFGLLIHLAIKNLSNSGINLAPEHFLLLSEDGKEVDSRKHLTSHDGDVVSQMEPHEIPKFLPPLSAVKATLEYRGSDSPVKLWINIPNECTNKNILIKPRLHDWQIHSYIANTKNAEDIAYFYNYHFKFDKLDKVHPGNSTVAHPIITKEVLNLLIIPKDFEFLRKYSSILDPEIFQEACDKGEFIDWETAKKHCRTPDELRALVKKNFQAIENQCAQGKCGILSSANAVEPYMDQEIIEFLIPISLKHLKSLKDWQFPYITKDNETQYIEYLKQFDFRQKLNLFKTSMNLKTINDIIVSSDICDFPLFKTLKLRSYFQDKIFQSTLDNLVLRYEIKTKEDLLSLRPALSEEGWKIAKARFITLVENEIQ